VAVGRDGLGAPTCSRLFGANTRLDMRIITRTFVFMNNATSLSPQIREDVLRDPRYPVHKIADQLLPYLQVLVEQFHPEQVILFGSYAYGEPNQDSDVDLLVVKELQAPQLEEAVAIRKAWRATRRSGVSLPFDVLLESPQSHRARIKDGAGFYNTITRCGLRLA